MPFNEWISGIRLAHLVLSLGLRLSVVVPFCLSVIPSVCGGGSAREASFKGLRSGPSIHPSETRLSNAACDLRVRWKAASDLRFRAAISEPKTPSCCGISGDLAPSTQKSLAIAAVRFWCAKLKTNLQGWTPNQLASAYSRHSSSNLQFLRCTLS